MRSYYLFFQGAKSANSELFKDFCNAEKTNKNEQKCGNYFVSIPNSTLTGYQ
jgi:hypothetical protein